MARYIKVHSTTRWTIGHGLPGCRRSMHSSVFLMCDVSTELIYCLFDKSK